MVRSTSLLISAVWCRPRAVDAGRWPVGRRYLSRMRSRSALITARSAEVSVMAFLAFRLSGTGTRVRAAQQQHKIGFGYRAWADDTGTSDGLGDGVDRVAGESERGQRGRASIWGGGHRQDRQAGFAGDGLKIDTPLYPHIAVRHGGEYPALMSVVAR